MKLNDRTNFIKNKIGEIVKKNKYVALLLILGMILVLVPSGKSEENSQREGSVSIDDSLFSIKENEERLERILSKIDGVGKVSVMLSIDGSSERIIAEDKIKNTNSEVDYSETSEESETVILDLGTKEGVVELRYIYPRYTGAVIVAEGADNPSVKLSITQAVASITGLGSNSVSVMKMANN